MLDNQLSIIITTYKALDYLKLCVDSLLTNNRCQNQIIIYADGSENATLEYLQTFANHPNVKFRYEKENVGITRALNRAALMADNPYLYFVNDDMVFAPGFDEALLRHARPDRVLTGAMIEPERPNQRLGKMQIKANFGMVAAAFDRATFDQEAPGLGGNHLLPGIAYPFMIAKDLYWQVGAIDERFSGPCHDPDLFYRITLSGAEMLRVPDSLCYHFSGRSLRFEGDQEVVSANWIRAETDAQITFLWKWGERPPQDRLGVVPRPGVTEHPDGPWPLWRRCYITFHAWRYRTKADSRLQKLNKMGLLIESQ